MKIISTLLLLTILSIIKPIKTEAQAANVADSLVLVDLYNSTNGAQWLNNTGWLTGPVSKWYGVTLDAGGRVSVIGLGANNLTGNIPASLGNLVNLQSLGLYKNQLSGSIPPELGSLTNLQILTLFNNQLSGNIPASLGNLTNLQSLGLYNNQLNGSIPSSLTNLKSLVGFNFSYNYFTFDGMEAILQKFNSASTVIYYSPQLTVLPINNNSNKLTVSAGGTLSNNTYTWYNGATLVKTITGDSSYVPTAFGSYSVSVTNAVANQLTLHSETIAVTTIANQDSLALVDLYNTTNGPNWLRHTNWLTGPLSTWDGITIDKTGRVAGIVLSQDSLKGSIPASFGNLTNLQIVHMEFNQLSGSIPAELGSLINLQYLYLDNNQLSGSIPAELGSLASMKYLELSENQLSGSIPVELGNLTNIQNILDLEGNKLTGSIPASLGSLVKLQNLFLTDNQLSGSIPAELGNLASVQDLDLSRNQLSGSIPAQLSNLANLQQLYLYNNQLTGSIPASLGSMAKLTDLGLYNNQLSGAIPTELSKLMNLLSLNLSNNQLSGVIPTSLGNLGSLQQLDLSFNQLSGSIPTELGNIVNLHDIELSSNQLTGSIPSSLANLKNLSYLYLRNNHLTFDGMEAIVQKFGFAVYFPQLTVLPINNNSDKLTVSAGGTLSNNTYKWYNGATLVKTITGDSSYIPTATGRYSVAVTNAIANQLTLYSDTLAVLSAQQQDSLALVDLYNSTDGPNWLNHANWLTGPLSNWYGITLDNNGRVVSINLNNDSLKGSLPSSLGTLVELGYLYLANNQLRDSIPSTLGSLQNLKTLYLNGNQLSGTIPSTLGSIINLQNLQLDNNQLTGSIPATFGNFTDMKGLFLANNHLSGTIPKALTNLSPFNFGYTEMPYIASNYFTFDGMEAIALSFPNAGYHPQDTILPLHYNNNKLSVSAGGTLSNNTYNWYNGATLVKSITGDSTYTPAISGNYYVTVTNAVATQLTLYSDTVAVTANTLPVTLINFTGQLTHGNAVLNWQTATEINTAYFNVQRSVNGVQFNTVGKVTAAGNSTSIHNYAFTDALTGLNPVPPQLYYRLQVADKDGGVTYSKIIELNNTPDGAITLLYPNPVHDVLNVRLNGSVSKLSLTIVNVEGKLLLNQQYSSVAASGAVTINTSTLAAGIYILHVQYDGKSETKKFVKY